MIHRIYSSLPRFKNLKFKPGLNILLAEKSEGASSRQTRNRAGKSSLIEIVHFLTGADVKKNSLFTSKALIDETFGMEFDLADKPAIIKRLNTPRSGYRLDDTDISSIEWKRTLGQKMFNLHESKQDKTPTFRSLFAYFVRRVVSSAFITPEKQAAMQGTGDYQTALMYLLGMDWAITGDWQDIRDNEKTIKELKKATKKGAFKDIFGSAAELRTKLTVREDNLKKLKQQLDSFNVHPKYRELEKEADEITQKLGELSNENTIDLALIRDLENSIKVETPPELTDLKSVYEEAGVTLPDLVKKQYDDVQEFHESVISNRNDYLSGELEEAKSRIEAREKLQFEMNNRRTEIMSILKSHGALEQYTKLQAEVSRLETEVENLRKRFEAAENLETTKNNLDLDRSRLLQRLRREFKEQKERLNDAILAYEETSQKLYEDAGSMFINETSNGPEFTFKIHGARSKGIKNMQIFCFDLMLMRICAKRGIGPGFLIHDSHLFDGVDGRQVISALRVGADTAQELGFQYIVTMNEDDAFKEKEEGFDLNDYVLPIKLTDATEDGGLFGIRFD